MNTFTPLCTTLHQQVKEFFQVLHGHQSKTLSLFVVGAIRAESIVMSKVAEALREESDAKTPSIERRLQRFLSNKRIHVEEVWKPFLETVMPYFQNEPLRLVIDLTSYEEHAQIIYIGIIWHSRALPLVWKVMPGQEKWDQGLWDAIEELFQRLVPYLKKTDCTILGDSAFGCFPMVKLCQKYGWHYLFRICGQHTCEHWSAQGRLLPTCPVSELVLEPGKRFFGPIRLWQEDQIETNLSGHWEKGEEEALLVISDRKACPKRLTEYKERWKVEAMFEDMKSRGWNWEQSHVRRLDRVDRMLLVLFFLFWWLAHLAGSCIHNGRRDQYDRHDRRDKNIFRLGRLYLLDIERRERKGGKRGNLGQCLLFRGKPGQWRFSLRY
jgi:DDE family transposase